MIRQLWNSVIGAPAIFFVALMAAGFTVALAIANGAQMLGGQP